MFVSNKNSIFIVYACICVAGFAGLVALSSQETPINLSIAVVGLYGFFSLSIFTHVFITTACYITALFIEPLQGYRLVDGQWS